MKKNRNEAPAPDKKKKTRATNQTRSPRLPPSSPHAGHLPLPHPTPQSHLASSSRPAPPHLHTVPPAGALRRRDPLPAFTCDSTARSDRHPWPNTASIRRTRRPPSALNRGSSATTRRLHLRVDLAEVSSHSRAEPLHHGRRREPADGGSGAWECGALPQLLERHRASARRHLVTDLWRVLLTLRRQAPTPSPLSSTNFQSGRCSVPWKRWRKHPQTRADRCFPKQLPCSTPTGAV